MLENTHLCLWSVSFCQMARMEKRNQQSKTKGFNNMEGGGLVTLSAVQVQVAEKSV